MEQKSVARARRQGHHLLLRGLPEGGLEAAQVHLQKGAIRRLGDFGELYYFGALCSHVGHRSPYCQVIKDACAIIHGEFVTCPGRVPFGEAVSPYMYMHMYCIKTTLVLSRTIL